MDLSDPETLIELFRQQASAQHFQALLVADNDRFFEEQKAHKREKEREEGG